jgi:hypothetical protein
MSERQEVDTSKRGVEHQPLETAMGTATMGRRYFPLHDGVSVGKLLALFYFVHTGVSGEAY